MQTRRAGTHGSRAHSDRVAVPGENAVVQALQHRSTIARRIAIIGMVVVAMLSGGADPVSAGSLPPVLLVHGWGSSPATFATMEARLARAGRAVYAIALPGQDNVANAKAIRAFVIARHLERVDLVAHSMGGLSSRWFVKFLRGSISVEHYVSLGTPQYGLLPTCVLPLDEGGQMCPGDTFLRTLNADDDTPGPTRYTSISSSSDGIVPAASSRLDGGACLITDRGVTHHQLVTDARVYRQVVYALNGRCPPGFG
jgi:triacylglycerol lipase